MKKTVTTFLRFSNQTRVNNFQNIYRGMNGSLSFLGRVYDWSKKVEITSQREIYIFTRFSNVTKLCYSVQSEWNSFRTDTKLVWQKGKWLDLVLKRSIIHGAIRTTKNCQKLSQSFSESYIQIYRLIRIESILISGKHYNNHQVFHNNSGIIVRTSTTNQNWTPRCISKYLSIYRIVVNIKGNTKPLYNSTSIWFCLVSIQYSQ